MKLFSLILIILSFFGCATQAPPKRVYEEVIEITEINPNRLTALTKQNLFHLAKVYDLKPFLYTKKIHIQSFVVPHSHPVLTLNTRNAEKPQQLLSSWLHEEFHWWTSSKSADTLLAIADLKKTWPKVEAGAAADIQSTYLHLIVCYLEYRSLVHFLGEGPAKDLIGSLAAKDKIYPWIYMQVLQKENVISAIVKKHNLLPPPLT
jgi:hypothetical protein